jgi:hypothetical protein
MTIVTTAFSHLLSMAVRNGKVSVYKRFLFYHTNVMKICKSLSYATLELRNAPEPKRTDMLALIQKYNVTMLDVAPEAVRLGELYIRAGVIPEKYRLDAFHIAIASINALDCVLSFNYEHINKLKTKRITENINLMEGYKGVTICTPMEVLD